MKNKGLIFVLVIIFGAFIIGLVHKNYAESSIFSNKENLGSNSVGSNIEKEKSNSISSIFTKCGDEKCSFNEDSSNCCIDCGCPSRYSCSENVCKKLAECGNGIKEEGETSENCCLDTGCITGYKCEQNRCVELKPEINAYFNQYQTKSITYFKAKERSLGILTLQNIGNSIAKNIKIKISSPDGYFNDEIIILESIENNNQKTEEIKLIFTDKALEIATQIQIKLNLNIEFEDEDNMAHSNSETITSIFMGKNYMSWSEPKEVESWITPNHPIIKEFASKSTAGLAASSSVGTSEEQELAARWLLESMRAYGIRYVNDPFNKEGDYVQFPTETLTNKAGDCEDNAVLYASLLAAIGMEPVIILTPRHAFAGYINKNGELVPIETTSLDFDTALNYGINNINQNKENMQIIKLDWINNPQVILPIKEDLKLPSITKQIGACGLSFTFSQGWIAKSKVTFYNSGQSPGAGCAAIIAYDSNGNKIDENISCWTINPVETKDFEYIFDIDLGNVLSGYYCRGL